MHRIIGLTLVLFLSLHAMASAWQLEATDTTGYVAPALGNGQIGVVMSADGLRPAAMFTATAFRDGRPGQVSTLQKAIIPISIDLTADGGAMCPIADWRQTLDMRHAEVSTSYITPSMDVTCTMRALRSMPHALMAEVSITARRDLKLTLTNRPRIPSSLTDTALTPVTVWAEGGPIRMLRAEGHYNGGASTMVSVATISLDGNWRNSVADTLHATLRKGETSSFSVIGVTCTDTDFADAWTEAERQVIYALRQGTGALTDRHRTLWEQLRQSDIEIDGDPQLQTHVRSALYNLYSSIREGSRRSIAPMGLTSDKYFGHIFWDADTWILPVMAVLNPRFARSMVDYRTDHLPQARRRAMAYGYRGAMFPWESDHHGEESTPTFALTGPLEHHITADVAIGAWLYYCSTGDNDWLRREGYPLLRECADFWTSHVERNSDGSYSINNVVGADEYAIGVDDNAFTNGAARRALQYASQAAAIVGEKPDTLWAYIAPRIRIHRLPDGKTVKEHASYSGEMTKQADAELLAYPLGIITRPDEIESTIGYYAGKIDSIGGPAMSHAAMAVNYARMGFGDKAARLVSRAYRPNLRGAFLSIAETPGNNETYFMTGAGGLLQAIVFGYAGIDITENGITQTASSLPHGIKSVTVRTPHGIFTRTNR